jgi:DNA-binding XRE family transcriptional regulator
MADENPMGRAPRGTPTAEQDAKTESAVLAFVLEEHPAQLTITEVSLVLNADPNAPDSGDAVERASARIGKRGPVALPRRFCLADPGRSLLQPPGEPGMNAPNTSREIARRFGKNLARNRKRADLSQEELSLDASVHRTEISQLERGLRVPRIDTLVKLKDALEVSADDLLVGITWRSGTYRRGGFSTDEDEG